MPKKIKIKEVYVCIYKTRNSSLASHFLGERIKREIWKENEKIKLEIK